MGTRRVRTFRESLLPLRLALLLILTAANIPTVACLALPSSSSSSPPASALPPPARLQQLFQENQNSELPILLPCCYDGLTARLVARAGFAATFLTGFGASAVGGVPDTQLLSYAEMLQTCGTVAEALMQSSSVSGASTTPIPCIAVSPSVPVW